MLYNVFNKRHPNFEYNTHIAPLPFVPIFVGLCNNVLEARSRTAHLIQQQQQQQQTQSSQTKQKQHCTSNNETEPNKNERSKKKKREEKKRSL